MAKASSTGDYRDCRSCAGCTGCRLRWIHGQCSHYHIQRNHRVLNRHDSAILSCLGQCLQLHGHEGWRLLPDERSKHIQHGSGNDHNLIDFDHSLRNTNIQGGIGTRSHTVVLGPGEGVTQSGKFLLTINISVDITTPAGVHVSSLSLTMTKSFTVS